MEKIKILIVEDEPYDISLLKELIEERSDVEIVGYVKKVNELLSVTAKLVPDIALMDVTLHGESVFSVLPNFEQAFPSVGIIFTTISEKHAVEGMEFSSYPFILKPYDEDELNAAIDKYYIKKNGVSREKIELPEPDKRPYYIRNRDGLYAFLASDIVYVATVNGQRAVTVYTQFTEFRVGKSLGEFHEIYKLPDSVFRMRSYLINMSWLYAVNRNNNDFYEAQFKDPEKRKLKITHSEYLDLSTAFMEWMDRNRAV
jgi:two-component system response regulator LytT